MGLPKLTIPTYTLTVPSSNKKVKFRPFLAKEEKILLLVKQSENTDEILNAMKDIVDVCTFNKLDISSLALFDIEYIFLQIRAKSVGEDIEIDMRCNNDVPVDGDFEMDEDGNHKNTRKCGCTIPFVVDINQIKVDIPKGHSKIIKLEKDIGITMRYPSIDDLKMLEDSKADDVGIIKGLVENIFDRDNVYDRSEMDEDEFNEFIDTISAKQIEKIRDTFFYKMPSLKHTVKYKCPSCKNEGEYTFNGINDFF